jgi:hypothetical protein
MFRCPECGSWESECISDTPQPDCYCNRCLSARLESAEWKIGELEKHIRSMDQGRMERDSEIERLRIESAQKTADLVAQTKLTLAEQLYGRNVAIKYQQMVQRLYDAGFVPRRILAARPREEEEDADEEWGSAGVS